MNIFIILAAYALNGAILTIAKILVTHASPFLIIGIRMTIAGTLLFICYKFIMQKKVNVPRAAIPLMIQTILCTIFIPFALRFWSLQHLEATRAAFFYSFGPFITHTISCSMGQEKVSLKKIIGLIIGFCGIIPLLTNKSAGNFTLTLSLPELAIIGAIVIFSYSLVITQKIVRTYDISPILLNSSNLFFSGILGFIFSALFESNHTIESPAIFFGWMALAIIGANFICYNLYAYVLKKHSSTLLSFAGLTMPFFASALAWLYFGETLSWHNFLTTAIVLIGLFIFHSAEKVTKQKNINL